MSRPNNLSLVCLYFSVKKKKKKCPNNKKEIYNDKYRHTRDRLFGLSNELIRIIFYTKRYVILFPTLINKSPDPSGKYFINKIYR